MPDQEALAGWWDRRAGGTRGGARQRGQPRDGAAAHEGGRRGDRVGVGSPFRTTRWAPCTPTAGACRDSPELATASRVYTQIAPDWLNRRSGPISGCEIPECHLEWQKRGLTGHSVDASDWDSPACGAGPARSGPGPQPTVVQSEYETFRLYQKLARKLARE